MPLGGRLDGGAQYPVADFYDETGLLRDREKFLGRSVSAIGHAPANQCFDLCDFQDFEVDQRLIEELELAVLDCAPQSLLDDELCRGGGQQLRREVCELTASERLGAKQRRVRGPQQRLG